MLFMGEEWGSKAPFPFFCDFNGDLADAVRKGRRREFAGAYAKYGDEVPDPLAVATFRSAVLDWEARDRPAGRKRLALVRDLLALRRREIVPRLAGARFGDAQAADDGLLTAHWRWATARRLSLIANCRHARSRSRQHRQDRYRHLGRRVRQPDAALVGLWRIGAR